MTAYSLSLGVLGTIGVLLDVRGAGELDWYERSNFIAHLFLRLSLGTFLLMFAMNQIRRFRKGKTE